MYLQLITRPSSLRRYMPSGTHDLCDITYSTDNLAICRTARCPARYSEPFKAIESNTDTAAWCTDVTCSFVVVLLSWSMAASICCKTASVSFIGSCSVYVDTSRHPIWQQVEIPSYLKAVTHNKPDLLDMLPGVHGRTWS